MDRLHQHPPVGQHHIAYLFDASIIALFSYVACFISIFIISYCVTMVPSVPTRLW